MNQKFEISRRIGIDAGHRVMTHGSKCRNLHGHRYEIEAFLVGDLQLNGEQTDMVMDFGFIKDLMMVEIDEPCDHGFIASIKDLEVLEMFVPDLNEPLGGSHGGRITSFDYINSHVETFGFWSSIKSVIPTKMGTKLYIVPGIPTSEYLAAHWYGRLDRAIHISQGRKLLNKVRVWETPNCYSDFPCRSA